MNKIIWKTVVISVIYGVCSGVITVTHVKSSVESEKFTSKSEVRVENCLPLGVVSHPNWQILGHCCKPILVLVFRHLPHSSHVCVMCVAMNPRTEQWTCFPSALSWPTPPSWSRWRCSWRSWRTSPRPSCRTSPTCASGRSRCATPTVRGNWASVDWSVADGPLTSVGSVGESVWEKREGHPNSWAVLIFGANNIGLDIGYWKDIG